MSGLTPETGREISTLPALGSRRAPRSALISDLGGNSLRCNLTKTQEQKLIRAAKKGDEQALETLVRCHIRYIAKIAGDYRRMGLHEEDLLGEGRKSGRTARSVPSLPGGAEEPRGPP